MYSNWYDISKHDNTETYTKSIEGRDFAGRVSQFSLYIAEIVMLNENSKSVQYANLPFTEMSRLTTVKEVVFPRNSGFLASYN